MVKISIDDSELKEMIKKVASLGRDMRSKTAKAINQGLKEAKPFAEELISSTYNVGTPSLGIKNASATSLQGHIKGSGPMKPVSEFDPISTGGPRQVVSVSIIRGSRKPIVPSSRGPGISGAFMIPDGRVMERRQGSRYPIYPVSTIGIPQMLGSKKVSNPARDKMNECIMREVSKLWLDSF